MTADTKPGVCTYCDLRTERPHIHQGVEFEPQPMDCIRCDQGPWNTYRLGPWRFDLEEARRIVDDGRPTSPVAVDRGVPFGIRYYEEHLPHVDMTDPVLVAFPRFEDGSVPGPMIIDGWHRIARAHQEGIETLEAYSLTPDETDQIWRTQ